uniref:Uncharacterized protein MANES_04G122400 n=1 Tax=Rhizophora mucronata TaxID=61149 RepID=A0A2P2LKX6_RHIMU
MEGRIARSLMVVCVLLVLLSGNSIATTFQQCYAGCFVLCAITPGSSTSTCAFKCLKDCIFPSTPVETNNREETQQQFCKLGCAFSTCANISSKYNPGGEKVASCVNSCSGRCNNKNYKP